MRRIMTLTCLALSSLALAGGGSAPGAPRPVAPFATSRSLPANSPVKPGQTWVMNGVTADGEKLDATYKLSSDAPEWDESWDFDSEIGLLSYDPTEKTIFAANDTEFFDSDDAVLHVCYAAIEGQQARGILFTGDMDTFDEEFTKLAMELADANGVLTYDRLMKAAKDGEVNVGTCTMTRK